MKVLITQVRNGRIETPQGLLAEGQMVTVVLQEEGESVALNDEQKSFIQESIAQLEQARGWTAGTCSTELSRSFAESLSAALRL